MSSILEAPLYMGTAYKDIHVSSTSTRNHYIVSIDHDGILRDIYARVYCYKGKWYIWYEGKNYRTQVKDFTTAIQLLEKEIMQCVA